MTRYVRGDVSDEISPDRVANERNESGKSTATTALLAAFETLPEGEKQRFVIEICRRAPLPDSGSLDDELAAQAGDDLAALLDREEHEAR